MRIDSKRKNNFVNYSTIAIVLIVILLSTSINSFAQKKDKFLSEKNFDVELTEQGKKKIMSL